jgi:hypothetical protein
MVDFARPLSRYNFRRAGNLEPPPKLLDHVITLTDFELRNLKAPLELLDLLV